MIRYLTLFFLSSSSFRLFDVVVDANFESPVSRAASGFVDDDLSFA